MGWRRRPAGREAEGQAYLSETWVYLDGQRIILVGLYTDKVFERGA